MALILGLPYKSRFYINNTPVTVVKTEGSLKITLELAGKLYDVTEKESVEIYPSVFVSMGRPPSKSEPPFPRLVIDAPRDVVIQREDLWMKSHDRAEKAGVPNPH